MPQIDFQPVQQPQQTQQPQQPSTKVDFQPLAAPSSAAPNLKSATTISTYEPSLFDRAKQIFTAGIPSLSSRTIYDPKYGQQQLLSPEAALTPLQQTAHPIVTGVAEVAGGLTTPGNLALLGATGGLSESAPVLSKIASVAFGAQMFQGTVDSAQGAVDAYHRGDYGEMLRLGTHAVLGGAMTGMAIDHASARKASEATPVVRQPSAGGGIDFQPITQTIASAATRSEVPEPVLPISLAPKVGPPEAEVKSVAPVPQPDLTKAAKIEEANVAQKNPDWTKAEFDNLIMRARAVQLNPKASEVEKQSAQSYEESLRAQMSEQFPEPESAPESTKVIEPTQVTGPQPTQLKPGEELPRPLGQTIKSKLPPRTAVDAAAEAVDATEPTAKPVTYGEPEEPVKSTPIAKPVEPEKPRVPKATASPNELPPGLQSVLDKLENNRVRQSMPDRDPQALIGDRSERAFLEKERDRLTDNYARLLKEQSADASTVVKAKSQNLSEKIDYLTQAIAKRPQVLEQERAMRDAMAAGLETRPEAPEGLKRHIESTPLAVREIYHEALGDRTTDVPNRLYAKRVQDAIREGKEIPSDEASPNLLKLRAQYEDLKEQVRDKVKLTGSIADEDDVAKLKTLESKLVLGALRSHGKPQKADVAIAQNRPVIDVLSTGTGKAADIHHGGTLPVLTQKMWESEFGGAKGKGVPKDVNELQDKLNELKEAKAHTDAIAKRLDYFADAFNKLKRQGGFAGEAQEPFYSYLERVIKRSIPGRASADQVIATLKNAGVSQQEMLGSSMDTLLADAKRANRALTQKELLDFVDANKLKLEVTEKTALSPAARAAAQTWQHTASEAFVRHFETIKAALKSELGITDTTAADLLAPYNDTYENIQDFRHSEEGSHEPLFNALRRRGGEAAVERWKPLVKQMDELAGAEYDTAQMTGVGSEGTRYETYTLPGGENYRELLLRKPATEPTPAEDLDAGRIGPNVRADYHSPHFDEPNILAHLRVKDRVSVDGKKTLFLEEVQSDWAHAGAPETSQFGDTPKFPLPGTWHELAMKYALKEAAEKGYDQIAWTTGEQQAQRYGESNLVEEGVKHKRLYDEMIPQFLNRYTKKWGGRAGTTTFDLGETSTHITEVRANEDGTFSAISQSGEVLATRATEALARAQAEVNLTGENASDVGQVKGLRVTHSLQITPEMRRAIMSDGQRLIGGFSGRRLLTGMATGGIAGGATGAVVAGPVGGLVGSALGMAAGGVTSAFDLRSAFPTVYDRLSSFARSGAVDEDITPGLTAKSVIRQNRGELDRAQAQLKEQVRDLTRRIDKQWTAQQGLDYMVKAAHGQPMSAEEQTLADLSEQIFAPRREAIENLEHGSYENWRDNYFPGMYKKADAVTDWMKRALLSKRPIAGSGAFKRAKVFDDVSEAIAAGHTPLSTNPLTMVMLKAAEMDKYVMGHKTLADFKEQGIAKFFNSTSDLPKGWRKFDDRIAEVVSRNDAGERVIRGAYYGPADAVQNFNNYVSPGLKGLSPTAYSGYQVLRSIGNAENQFQLGMSAFHISTTGFNAIASDMANAFDQAGHGELLESGKSALRAVSLVGSIAKTYYDGTNVMKEYLSPGSLAKYTETANAVARAGGRASMDQQYISNEVAKVRDAYKEGRYASAALHVPFAGVELGGRFIMQHVVPPMKLGVFHGMAADIFSRAQEKGWSEAQMTRELDRAWNSVDGRMGQVVYDNIFVNKVAKELAFGTIRSAGWTGGTIAELGGGTIDAARSLARVATGDDFSLSRRTKYTIALAVTAGYIGALMNYGYTGHAPQSLRDMYQIPTGRIGSDGRKEYVNIPSYMKDLFAYRFQPGQTILNKAHPLLHSVAEMLQNKDYYNVEIAHQDDPALTQLREYTEFALKQFIPFSVTNAEHRIKGTPGSMLQSVFGVTPAPRYATMTPAERDLYNDNSRNTGGIRTQLAFDRSQFRGQLEEAFRSHDVETRRALIKEGFQKGILAPADLDKIIENSREPYFDSAVKRASIDDLAKLYATDKPNKEERRKIQLSILEKMDTSLDDKPPQERAEIMRMYKEGRAKQQ